MAVRVEIVVIVKKNRLPSVMAKVPVVVASALEWSAREVINNADRSFRGPKSGRVYAYRTASGGTILHQASAPGESPAILTETLAKSAEVQRFVGGVAATWDTNYASDLEFGAGRIAPRPFARPAAIVIFPRLVDRIRKDLGKI